MQPAKLRILHLEDDPTDGMLIQETLVSHGIDCETVRVETEVDFRREMDEYDFDLILADYSLPSFDGLTAMRIAHEMRADIPFILVSGKLGEETAIESLKAGATDYVLKNRLSGLAPAVLRALAEVEALAAKRRAEADLQRVLAELRGMKDRLQEENTQLRREIKYAGGHKKMFGLGRAMEAVTAQAEQVAATDSTVLVLGETGTGKELLARAIHSMGSRSKKPLVVVNCAAMPSALVESELFGHEKGAFTGAMTRKIGRFELAHQATIFLDEVGELPVETQAKLLRVLQEGIIERVGGTQPVAVNVRVIAATNRDLEAAVHEGRFREDLYYRLNVFPLTIPPLRERQEDIPQLVSSFVEEFNAIMAKRVKSVSRKSMDGLRTYSWPGNVRELRNLVERAMITAQGSTIEIPVPAERSFSSVPLETLADVEREHVHRVLKRTGWRIRGSEGAAEILGLKPSTLESRMVRLGLKRPAE